MLSFMREQEAGNPAERPSGEAGSRNPQAAEGPGAQEYLTVAANRQSLRRSTILVAILVAIGLVCLLFMIRKSQPQAASAKQSGGDEKKIEAAISRLTGVRSEMVDRMDEIVKKFYEFSDVFQVKVSELAKNPFQVEGGVKAVPGVAAVPEDPQAQAEQVRREKMQQQAATLRLLSIMRSDIGHSCMINDEILRQGDIIEGFVISQIGNNFVELTWLPAGAAGNASETEKLSVTLKLSE